MKNEVLDFGGETFLPISLLETTEDLPRSFLYTPFEEYTVTEGFLLLFLVLFVVVVCAKMIKGAFSWL